MKIYSLEFQEDGRAQVSGAVVRAECEEEARELVEKRARRPITRWWSVDESPANEKVVLYVQG